MTINIPANSIGSIIGYSSISEYTLDTTDLYFSYHGRIDPLKDELDRWKPLSEVHEENINYVDEFRTIYILNLSVVQITVEYLDDKLETIPCEEECGLWVDRTILNGKEDIVLGNFNSSTCINICNHTDSTLIVPQYDSGTSIGYTITYKIKLVIGGTDYFSDELTLDIDTANTHYGLVNSTEDKRKFITSIIYGNGITFSTITSITLMVHASGVGYNDLDVEIDIPVNAPTTQVIHTPVLFEVIGDNPYDLGCNSWYTYQDEGARYRDGVFLASDGRDTLIVVNHADNSNYPSSVIYYYTSGCGLGLEISRTINHTPYCIASIKNINSIGDSNYD